jgi:hypothetical protein
MTTEVSNMREATYEAAHAVAPTIEAHFARHIAAARERGEEKLAPNPNRAAIEAIIDATFWASLRREEGRSPKISLAFFPHKQVPQPLIFEQPLALTPDVLTKLGPAVERPGIHLGVDRAPDGELRVWGATRKVPSLCFVLEVIEPGLLVIKHRRRDGFGKFANVAVLKGQEIKIVDEHGASLPVCRRCWRPCIPSLRRDRGTTSSICTCNWPRPCGLTDMAARCCLYPQVRTHGASPSFIRFSTR